MILIIITILPIILRHVHKYTYERCSKSKCVPATLTKFFREGLRGASAAVRVAYASGVYIAKDSAALTRIEFLVKASFRVFLLMRTQRNHKS